MGKSRMYHVIGYTDTNSEGLHNIYCAMTLIEMEQLRKKIKRDGKEIKFWVAQTRTGVRMLGSKCLGIEYEVLEKDVPRPKRIVTCEPCGGGGCFVCNQSGVCSPGYWKRWNDWQLTETRNKRDECIGAVLVAPNNNTLLAGAGRGCN